MEEPARCRVARAVLPGRAVRWLAAIGREWPGQMEKRPRLGRLHHGAAGQRHGAAGQTRHRPDTPQASREAGPERGQGARAGSAIFLPPGFSESLANGFKAEPRPQDCRQRARDHGGNGRTPRRADTPQASREAGPWHCHQQAAARAVWPATGPGTHWAIEPMAGPAAGLPQGRRCRRHGKRVNSTLNDNE